jgi:hypothetical protein
MEQRQDDYQVYHRPPGVKWGCLLYFYMNQGYTGEQCGPWASCFCLSRFVMAELLQTERTYVKDLEVCVKVWKSSRC